MKLIEKDAVLAEIERLQDTIKATAIDNRISKEQAEAYKVCVKLRSFVEDSLEVKEMELDMKTFGEEMTNVFNLPSNETTNTEEEPLNWEYAIAKHFFELGLKAQKVE